MEYNFDNELEYIVIWCKLKMVAQNPKRNREFLENVNKRVAERLNVLHVSLDDERVVSQK